MMLRVSQRLPAPPAAAAALPSAEFCCLPTEEAPAAPPGQTRRAVTGAVTSHRSLRRGSCASQHGSESAFSSLSYAAAEGPQPFPQPSQGSGPGSSPGQHQQPWNSQGPPGGCFPPAFPQDTAVGFGSTTLEIPFLLQSGVRAFAGQTQCPVCQGCGKSPDVPSVPQVALALPQGCESTVSHSTTHLPLPWLGTGAHLGMQGWLPPWDLGSDIVGSSSDRATGGLLAARAGTREFSACWFRAQHWSEVSGHSGDTRSARSVQDTVQPAADPPPSPSSAGTAPPRQPLGSPGETAVPGLLQPLPILCKRVVIKT